MTFRLSLVLLAVYTCVPISYVLVGPIHMEPVSLAAHDSDPPYSAVNVYQCCTAGYVIVSVFGIPEPTAT
mgnify:FL=1